jgi:hypothetical protein
MFEAAKHASEQRLINHKKKQLLFGGIGNRDWHQLLQPQQS